MKKLAIALLCAAMICGPAAASKRDRVMHRLAEVVATASLCPDLQMNTLAMAVVSKAYGLKIYSGTADFDEMMRLSSEQMNQMSDNSQDAVCAAGRYLYGPNGVAGKNLLLEK